MEEAGLILTIAAIVVAYIVNRPRASRLQLILTLQQAERGEPELVNRSIAMLIGTCIAVTLLYMAFINPERWRTWLTAAGLAYASLHIARRAVLKYE